MNKRMNRQVCVSVASIALLAVLLLVAGCGKSTEPAKPSISAPQNAPSVADTAKSAEKASAATGAKSEIQSDGNELTGQTVIDVAAETPASDAVEFNIVAKDMKFDPAVLTVKKGQKIRMRVTADDRTYGFALAEFHVKDTVYRGETKTVEFTPDKYGTFIFFSRREWNDGKIGELGRLVVTLN